MKTLVSIILIVLLLIFGFIALNKPQDPEKSAKPSPTPIIHDQKVNIKASFMIITGTITRSFQAEKYHNQSPDVYLEKSDPAIVHVIKRGITWDDFFRTLPMKLTKDCLITGDGEMLCSGKNGSLKFYLNNVGSPNLLDQEIKDGDKALIKFL